jgi:hypothetical protein
VKPGSFLLTFYHLFLVVITHTHAFRTLIHTAAGKPLKAGVCISDRATSWHIVTSVASAFLFSGHRAPSDNEACKLFWVLKQYTVEELQVVQTWTPRKADLFGVNVYPLRRQQAAATDSCSCSSTASGLVLLS